jgi:tripartite-type tricarboxylate transporter receptor subunit TctC
MQHQENGAHVKAINPSVRRAFLGALLVAAAGCAIAQTNLTKLVVPYTAGGVTDQAARIVAERMARELGTPVIVENRPGAAGRIAIDAVAKAAPDGTTLLFTNSSYSILPIVDPQVHFDPLKTLTPVALAATYGLQIVTRPELPAKTLQEFIAYARSHPGKLSYGSSGMGSGAHFAGEYFKSLTGTYLVHIPYKSTSGALTDIAGGLLDLAFDGSAKPLIDAGRVKLLAVTSAKRDPRFPNTPTAQEAGLKGFVLTSWVGLLAPAATPEQTLDRLSKAAAIALADPAVRQRLADMGLQAEGGPASRLADFIRSETGLYRKIATDSHLRFE